MKLVKIQVSGLPHFKENLEIDFFCSAEGAARE